MSFIRNFKKGISLSLALMILLLSSCGSSDNKAPDKNSSDESTAKVSESVSESQETVPEETTSIIDSLPVADFEGKTIRGTTFDEGEKAWKYTILSSEELNGEILNDTIYNRNLEVENRLNVKLEFEYYKNETTLNANIRKVLMSGDPVFDYVVPNMGFASQIAQDDYLMDLTQIESIDLTSKAWDQSAIKSFSIFNKLYYGICDISLGKNETVWVNMFNKRLIDELRLENPYELVKSGKWTFDKMNEMMEAAFSDINGDGKIRFMDDRYGLSTHDSNFHALLIAGGEPFCEINDEGVPVITGGDDRYIEVYDKISQLFGNDNLSYIGYDHLMPIFRKGGSLFAGEVMAYVRHLRDMEDDFGIIPVPKYDEAQSNYYSYGIPYEIMPVCLPVTSSDPETTGTVLQAMAMLSEEFLNPAYYEITIEGKGMRDEESVEMLDLILDSTVYDWALLYKWGKFADNLPSLLNKQKEFASSYKAKENLINKELQATIDAFANNEN